MIKSLLRTVAAVAVVAGLALPAQAADPVKVKLVLPTAITTFMLPYLVSADQGWFKQNGLDVEEVFVSGDSTALRTVISGGGDLTVVGPFTVFEAAINGAKVKAIGSWQPIVDYRLVADKNVAKTLKELEGKTFASAGPADMTTELPKMVMKKNGFDGSSLKFIQIGGHPARLQAVEAGKVQAAMINTLMSVKGEMDGKTVTIAKITDDFRSFGYVSITATDANLANPEKRKAYETFLKGSTLGARYVMQHPAEAAAILKKRDPEQDLAMITKVVSELNGMKVWGVNGGNDAEVLAFTSKTAVDLKMSDREVKLQEVMDNSLQDKVLAEIGKM